MSSNFNFAKVDIEETIESKLEQFKREHNRTPEFLVIGRIAYEELRDLSLIGQRHDSPEELHTFRGLTVSVVEEPASLVAIGCKPD